MKTPTPNQLACTPELAILSILHRVLDVTVATLIAEHPQLTDDERPYWVNEPPPSCHLAHVVVSLAMQLRDCLNDYRRATACERKEQCIGIEHEDDDIPF